MHPLQKKLLECMVAGDRSGFYTAVDRIMGTFGDEIKMGALFSHSEPENTSIDELNTHQPANWFNDRMWRSNRYLRVRGSRLIFDFERTDRNGLRMICVIRAHRRALEAEGFTFEEVRMGAKGQIEQVVEPKATSSNKATKRRNIQLITVTLATIGALVTLLAVPFNSMIFTGIGIALCLPLVAISILYWLNPLEGKKKKKATQRKSTARKR